jgi:hypothetical protein
LALDARGGARRVVAVKEVQAVEVVVEGSQSP